MARSLQQSDHSLARNQLLTFATIAVSGGAALLLGLALIIFAQYHERAYIFLGLGAGGLIGRIEGQGGAELWGDRAGHNGHDRWPQLPG